MSTPPPFLLHPKNQRYLDGKDRFPWSVRPPFWGYFALTFVPLLLLVAFLVYFWREQRVADYLNANGTATTAVVTHSYVHMGDDHDTGRISFRYTAKDGEYMRLISRTHNTRPETAERYGKGARMKVLYDPNNPDLVRISDEIKGKPHPEIPGDDSYFALKLIAAFPIFLSLMGFAGWLRMSLLPMWRLRRNPGQLLKGEVIESKGEWDNSDNYQLHLRIRFTTPAGKSIESWMKPGHRDDLHKQPPPIPGTPVHFYYIDDVRYWVL